MRYPSNYQHHYSRCLSLPHTLRAHPTTCCGCCHVVCCHVVVLRSGGVLRFLSLGSVRFSTTAFCHNITAHHHQRTNERIISHVMLPSYTITHFRRFVQYPLSSSLPIRIPHLFSRIFFFWFIAWTGHNQRYRLYQYHQPNSSTNHHCRYRTFFFTFFTFFFYPPISCSCCFCNMSEDVHSLTDSFFSPLIQNPTYSPLFIISTPVVSASLPSLFRHSPQVSYTSNRLNAITI